MSTSTVPFAQSGSGGTLRVSQAAHGFTQGQAIQLNGATWALAKSDDSSTLAVGLADVIDANTFRVVHSGTVTGLVGLTAGEYYYVSSTTAGALTATEPITGFSNPILLATSATAGIVLPYRPSGAGVAAMSYMTGKVNVTNYATNISNGDHIKFDSVIEQGGSDIGLDTTTPYTNATNAASLGRITLVGGKVYELSAQLYAGAGYVYYGWYNADTNTALDQGHSTLADNSATGQVSATAKTTIFSPSVTTRVELRIISASGLSVVYGTSAAAGSSSFSVKTIAATIQPASTYSMIRRTGGQSFGSTNTSVLIYSNSVESQGTDITYTNSATNGDSFLINSTGVYSVSVTHQPNTAGWCVIKVAGSIDNVGATNNATRAISTQAFTATAYTNAAWTGLVQAGDRIWVWASGAVAGSAITNQITIVKIG